MEWEHGVGAWSGSMEWERGVGPWSGTVEWDRGVGPWSGTMEWDRGVGGSMEWEHGVGLWSGSIEWEHGVGLMGTLEWEIASSQRRRSGMVALDTWLKKHAQLNSKLASAFKGMTRDKFNLLPLEAVISVARNEIASFGFGGKEELRRAWMLSRQSSGRTGHTAQTPVASNAPAGGVVPDTLCLDSEPPAQG